MKFEARLADRVWHVELRSSVAGDTVSLDGRELPLDLVETADHFLSLLLEGRSYELSLEPDEEGALVHFPGGLVQRVVLASGSAATAAAAPQRDGPARLTAPMPGRVVRVLVAPGAAVEAGQALLVVEAMKMENELRSPRSGEVQEVAVREGQAVEAGALLVLVT